MRKPKLPKTKKQVEAKRLYDQMLHLQMSTHESLPYTRWGREMTDKFELCDINGIRYITMKNLNYYAPSILQKMVGDGLLPDARVLHFRAQPIKTIINLHAVVANRELIINTLGLEAEEVRIFNAVVDAAKKAEGVTEMCIADKELQRTEELYQERTRLIYENSRETRHQQPEPDEQPEPEEERQPTLQELVDQIEAMGWEVTLRRVRQTR